TSAPRRSTSRGPTPTSARSTPGPTARSSSSSRAGRPVEAGRRELCAAHLAPAPGLEPAQLEPADPHPLEPDHFVADGLEQPPDLPVLALPQLHDQVRLPPRGLPQRHGVGPEAVASTVDAGADPLHVEGLEAPPHRRD